MDGQLPAAVLTESATVVAERQQKSCHLPWLDALPIAGRGVLRWGPWTHGTMERTAHYSHSFEEEGERNDEIGKHLTSEITLQYWGMQISSHFLVGD